MSFAELKRNRTDLSKLVEQAKEQLVLQTPDNQMTLASGSLHEIRLAMVML